MLFLSFCTVKISKLNFKTVVFVPVKSLLLDETCFGAKLQRGYEEKCTMNSLANVSIFVGTIRD